MSDKICVQCKHYRYDRTSPPGSQHRCDRLLIDLVTGDAKKLDAICADERYTTPPIPVRVWCGVDGQFWEAR